MNGCLFPEIQGIYVRSAFQRVCLYHCSRNIVLAFTFATTFVDTMANLFSFVSRVSSVLAVIGCQTFAVRHLPFEAIFAQFIGEIARRFGSCKKPISLL